MFDFKRPKEESCIMNITPELAQQLLNTSPGNRNIRYWHVGLLSDAMRRGEWRVTSQGIGIDINGHLRDAHHRLMAVVKANVSIRSVVVMGLPLNAYEVIDTGIKRNLSDLLHENKRVTDILNIAGILYYDTNRVVSIDQLKPVMESGLLETAKSLVKFCGTARSFYSSAPIKLSACLQILNGGDEDYIKKQYRALCLLDFKSMSASAMALIKQVEDGKADARNNRKDAFARGLRVFDFKQRGSEEARIKQEDLDNAKTLLMNLLKPKDGTNEATIAAITTDNGTKPPINAIKPHKPQSPRNNSHSLNPDAQELDELLTEAHPEPKSYIHKLGNRQKFAKA